MCRGGAQRGRPAAGLVFLVHELRSGVVLVRYVLKRSPPRGTEYHSAREIEGTIRCLAHSSLRTQECLLGRSR